MLRTFLITILFLLAACATPGDRFMPPEERVYTPIVLPEKQVKKLTEEKLPPRAWKYSVYWAGLPVGDLYGGLVPTKDGYEIKTIIQSWGIARLITQWRSESESKIAYKDGNYIPQHFHTHFNLRKKHRDITLIYDTKGELISEENEPPENRNKRPAVEQKLKIGAVDPLTLALVTRQRIIEAVKSKKKHFTVAMYDSRRRTDIDFTLYGLDKKGNLHTSFVETPVAGYTNNELKKMKERAPVIHLYFDTENFWPVYGQGKSPLGTAYAKLKKECKTIEECMG